MFSLGQHSGLDSVISRLEEGERFFAYLDDLYVMCDPGRVAEVHSILEEELWRHARIQIDQEASARMMDPHAIVWRDNGEIPNTKQGLKILDARLATLISSRTSSPSYLTATTFCWGASIVQLRAPISRNIRPCRQGWKSLFLRANSFHYLI